MCVEYFSDVSSKTKMKALSSEALAGTGVARQVTCGIQVGFGFGVLGGGVWLWFQKGNCSSSN